MTADQLLVLDGLRVEIADRAVVTGLDLTVRSGCITALVGESGSGKSMTALATIGLQPRVAEVHGSARLGGEELVGRSAQEMRRIRSGRIGMIFQEPGQSLSPVMKVSAVFKDVLAQREGLRATARVRERTRELLDSVGLPDPDRTARSYPHELSGGELQRVVIALALSGDPSLLIADEPTTALDVTVQRGILDLLVRIVQERRIGILLITHDMGVVGEIADEVVVLKDGEAVEKGGFRRVLSAPSEPYTTQLLSAVPRLAESLERSERDEGPEIAGAAAETAGATLPRARQRPGRVCRWSTAARGARAPRPGRRVYGDPPPGDPRPRPVEDPGPGESPPGATALAGLVPLEARRLELDGVDPRTLPSAERRAAYARVGLVFQDPASSLNPRRTVGWSIGEPLKLAGRTSRAEIDRRVRHARTRGRCALPPLCSTRAASRTSSPGVSASASRSPELSSSSRPCSSPTSPRAPWTSRSRRTSSRCSATRSRRPASPACSSATTSPWSARWPIR